MKTIFTLSLLPIIVLAYFLSVQLYVAGNYVAAYALIAMSFVAVVFCIYQVGSILERQRGQ
jgi:hypothetical protein